MKKIYSKIREQVSKKLPFDVLNDRISQGYYTHHTFKPYNINWTQYNEKVQEHFSYLNNSKQEEYIFCYTEKCKIEPEWGWAITNNNKLILESVPGNNWRYKEKWHTHPFPNKIDLLLKSKSQLFFDEIIYLNHFYNFGKNYYHFFNDLLGQIYFLHKNNVDLSLPVLVHKSIFETAFFQEILDLSPFLKNLNWVVLKKKYIQTKKLWVARNPIHQEGLVQFIHDILNINTVNNTKNNKVFLTRHPSKRRTPTNIHVIEDEYKSHGYEIVDCGYLSVKKQIEMFQNTERLAGLHGAGLTNMIWRYPNKMEITEIFSENYIFHHYFLLSKHCNHFYNIRINDY